MFPSAAPILRLQMGGAQTPHMHAPANTSLWLLMPGGLALSYELLVFSITQRGLSFHATSLQSSPLSSNPKAPPDPTWMPVLPSLRPLNLLCHVTVWRSVVSCLRLCACFLVFPLSSEEQHPKTRASSPYSAASSPGAQQACWEPLFHKARYSVKKVPLDHCLQGLETGHEDMRESLCQAQTWAPTMFTWTFSIFSKVSPTTQRDIPSGIL